MAMTKESQGVENPNSCRGFQYKSNMHDTLPT